jgi:hypothetical protein
MDVRVARTAELARLVMDIHAGAAVTLEEGHRRLRCARTQVRQYLEGIWSVVPPTRMPLGRVEESMTPTELAIATYLAYQCGRFLDPGDICRDVLGHEFVIRPTQAIGSHMVHLREKGLPLRTWRGRGYALDGRALRRRLEARDGSGDGLVSGPARSADHPAGQGVSVVREGVA